MTDETYRVRNRKTGKWIELPAWDGLIPASLNGRTIYITAVQAVSYARAYIGNHDKLSARDRWRANYGGNACLQNKLLRVPVDKTTPDIGTLAGTRVEDLL